VLRPRGTLNSADKMVCLQWWKKQEGGRGCAKLAGQSLAIISRPAVLARCALAPR
jgi:hypothetical protein